MGQPGVFDTVAVSVIGLAILLLGLAVFYRNRKAATNKAFFVFVLSVDAWIISAFLSELGVFEQYRLFLSKLAYANVSIAIVLLFNLILVFSNNWLKVRYLNIVRSLYFIFSGVVVTLVLLTDSIIQGIKYESWGFDLINGALYFIFPLFILSNVALVFYTLTVSYFKSSKQTKKQLQYLLIGLFLFVGATAFVNIIVREIAGTDQYYRWGNYSVIFFIGFTAYAIVKHRLMDIRLLVLRSVAYAISLALVVGGYISLTVLVFHRLQPFINPIALNIITLLALVSTVNPLRVFIENHTDRIFAKGRYSPAELRKELEEISLKYAKQEDLTKNWLKVITSQMRINRAAVVLMNSPQLNHIESLNFKVRSTNTWQNLANVINKNKQMIVADELDDESDVKDILREMGVEVALPIIDENKMVGFFALGQKLSGDMYTSQDLNLLNNFLRNAAVALERSKTMKEKEKEVIKVKALYNQAEKSISSVKLDDVLNTTIDAAFMATNSDGGSIMLYNERTKTLTIRTSRGIPKVYHYKKIKLGEGIAGKVALKRKPEIVGIENKELARYLKREHIKSAMCVPLEIRGKLVGVLSVNRANNKELFNKDDLELVSTIAANIAQRIENATLIEEDRQRDKEIINIFNKALETRDHYTQGHSENVTRYSVAIAKEMGFDKEQINKIEKAGVLHDIGKIGIHDNILQKEEPLTDKEYETIKEHPIKSRNLIIESSKLKDVAEFAMYHHERYDGDGYPSGLSGEDIPLEARILAVADSFDAMVSERPYKDPKSLSDAKQELVRNKGSQFDPEVVDVFLKIVDKLYKEKQLKKEKLKSVQQFKAGGVSKHAGIL